MSNERAPSCVDFVPLPSSSDQLQFFCTPFAFVSSPHAPTCQMFLLLPLSAAAHRAGCLEYLKGCSILCDLYGLRPTCQSGLIASLSLSVCVACSNSRSKWSSMLSARKSATMFPRNIDEDLQTSGCISKPSHLPQCPKASLYTSFVIFFKLVFYFSANCHLVPGRM